MRAVVFILTACLLTAGYVSANCPDIPPGPTGATGPKGPTGLTGPDGSGSGFGDWAFALGTTGPQSIPAPANDGFPPFGSGTRILFDSFSTSGNFSFNYATGELTVVEPGVYLIGWSFSINPVFDREGTPSDISVLTYVLDETNMAALPNYPFQGEVLAFDFENFPRNMAGEIIALVTTPNTVISLRLYAGSENDQPTQAVEILLEPDFWIIKVGDYNPV